MSYNYSKGAQVIGDLKAADDVQRNTQIDFGEDEIALDTSGSTRVHVGNTTTTITNTLHLSGSDIEALRIAKGGNDYKQIVFETDGTDTANIHLSNAENLVLQNETNGKEIQFWVNPNAGSSVEAMTIAESGKIGIGVDPTYKLDIDGDIRVRGNDIRDNSGNKAITFDGSANTIITGNLSVSGSLYYEDFIIAELSIPGVDLQTDTNAFTFNCPYSMTVEGLQLFLDQHTTSGNVTVEVSGSGNGMIALSLTGTNTNAQTTTVSNASLNGGDQVRFSITATPANAQGLRANLQFRRVSD